MSVSSSEALERSVLEGKDRDQLITIAGALGVKALTRAKKADIIDRILEQVGAAPAPAATAAPAAPAVPESAGRVVSSRAARPASLPLDDANGDGVDGADGDGADGDGARRDGAGEAPAASAGSKRATAAAEPILGPDGEPLAEWEADLVRAGEPLPTSRPEQRAVRAGGPAAGAGAGAARSNGANASTPTTSAGPVPASGPGILADDSEREGGRRRRRRNRNRRGGEDGLQGNDRDEFTPTDTGVPAATPASDSYGSNEPVDVDGYLDLRDEGYGFLRVGGYLPSRDDAYVSVKQTRQYGLRKGDHLAGTCRPAGRNEKNPALLSITAVNGGDPEAARMRPPFDDLTPVLPDEWLRLAPDGDVSDPVARVVDLVAPIAKGQRGLLIAPPRSGKSSVVAAIAAAIERNHPDVTLMVLLVDERPEEVTAMRRAVHGEVVASTFDRPNDEHVHVAELALEKAKRLVESGADVVVLIDGLSRLVRAHQHSQMATGRTTSGGVDLASVHAAKRLLGAARNMEEGGSLTVLATVAADTGARTDDAIVEELAGTANLMLRLDRSLADRRVQPPVDVAASGTRHEDAIVDAAQLADRVEARQHAIAAAASGAAPSAVEALLSR